MNPEEIGPPQRFAKRLRELLTASGLTQGELARRAGVSPQVVSRLLASGNADVTLSIACRLAWAMGKGVAEFEKAVFEEWKEEPMTLKLIDQELTRGRLRQKLNAVQARIADYQESLVACSPDRAGQVARKWAVGMIRHWREQARELETELRKLG